MILEPIHFKNRQSLRIEVATEDDLPQALDKLGLASSYPVIVLVGGAGGISDEDQRSVRQVVEVIAQTAQDFSAAVIDGGTQSGIMKTIGLIRSQNGYQFPLVGVCASDTVTWPGRSRRFWKKFKDLRASLDPNHTHFILVPGKNWGDESIWIAEIATKLAGGLPSIAILINGGQIARDQDIPHNLKAGRKIFVIEGSGRAADEFATFPPDTELMKFIHISEPERLSKQLSQHFQHSK